MDLVLVDSNVILDVLTEDPRWCEWSSEQIAHYGDRGLLAINPIIYGEVSTRFSTIEELEAVLARSIFKRLPLPWEAAFLAGKCFMMYRKRGGTKNAPLPDFYIGAHAAISGMTLITRDVARYRTYFPTLNIVVPNA